MTIYVSGIVQRASPNVGAGRFRPAGRSLGTPDLKCPIFKNKTKLKSGTQNAYFEYVLK